MKTPPPLAREFQSYLSIRLNIPEDPLELEDLLRGAFEKAATEWPKVQLSPDAFICHLARRMPRQFAGKPLGDALAKLPLGELYLACAAALGNEPAISEIDHRYLTALSRILAALNLGSDVDDILQTSGRRYSCGRARRNRASASMRGEARC